MSGVPEWGAGGNCLTGDRENPILGYRLTASKPTCDQLLTFGIAPIR
jgi:hypothetical protein